MTKCMSILEIVNVWLRFVRLCLISIYPEIHCSQSIIPAFVPCHRVCSQVIMIELLKG